MRLIYLVLVLLMTSCLATRESNNNSHTDSTLVKNHHLNHTGQSYHDDIDFDTDSNLDSLIREFNKIQEEKKIEIQDRKIASVEPDYDGDGVPDNSTKPVKIKYKKNNNIIKKETPEISLGNVIYQTPDTMILLVESRVIVRISKGKLDTNQMSQDLNGDVNVVPINVTSKMEVKLVDPSPESSPSFDIKSVNKSEQVIEDEVYTEWDFTVIPLKTGLHELKLVISIIKGDRIKEQTWSDTIKVKNNVPKKVLSFWEKYWQWLLTTIIIPIIVYFWKKREEKKKS